MLCPVTVRDVARRMWGLRRRLSSQGPLIAMYATANDVIPMPYKERIEAALQRQAIRMYDIATARNIVKSAEVRAREGKRGGAVRVSWRALSDWGVCVGGRVYLPDLRYPDILRRSPFLD